MDDLPGSNLGAPLSPILNFKIISNVIQTQKPVLYIETSSGQIYTCYQYTSENKTLWSLSGGGPLNLPT